MFDELGDIAHDKVVLEGQRDDCLDRIADLERSLAASRALVVEKDKALDYLYTEVRSSFREKSAAEKAALWQTKNALILTEEEMQKRLERKEA